MRMRRWFIRVRYGTAGVLWVKRCCGNVQTEEVWTSEVCGLCKRLHGHVKLAVFNEISLLVMVSKQQHGQFYHAQSISFT